MSTREQEIVENVRKSFSLKYLQVTLGFLALSFLFYGIIYAAFLSSPDSVELLFAEREVLGWLTAAAFIVSGVATLFLGFSFVVKKNKNI